MQAFEEIQARIQAHYQAGEYSAALDLATEEYGNYPQHAPLFYYWRICMNARLGQNDQSLALMKEVLQGGLWYSETLLRKSPSLQALQGQAAFEKLVARNRRVQAQDQKSSFPLLTLRPQGQCKSGEPPCPLLLALHANASTAQASLDFWRQAASRGWLVALPQSTQGMWKDAYMWDDLDITRNQVVKQVLTLQQQYALQLENTVLAGHSMGGEVAIWLALSATIPAKGFIAIGPGGPMLDDLQSWLALIEQAPRPLRGYFAYGEEDTSISPASIQSLAEMLDKAGIPCEVETIPGVAHDFQPEFANAVLRGLDHITGS